VSRRQTYGERNCAREDDRNCQLAAQYRRVRVHDEITLLLKETNIDSI